MKLNVTLSMNLFILGIIFATAGATSVLCNAGIVDNLEYLTFVGVVMGVAGAQAMITHLEKLRAGAIVLARRNNEDI